jgi:ATP-dependent Clp protease ATP-binding subunit ClpC
MPKINVYLPDDLAVAVKAANIPVSAVCQRALTDAVRAAGRARLAIAAIRDPEVTPDRLPELGAGRVTPRLSQAIALARQIAGGRVETRHLLAGLLDEGENLGLRVLHGLEVDTEELRASAAADADAEPAPAHEPEPTSPWANLSAPSRLVLAATAEAALDLAHNYLGCEHLLIGLTKEPGTRAGALLAERGVDTAAATRAVGGATIGFAHARANAGTTPSLADVVRRLDDLERRLSAQGG